jgi:hypothetical protein
MVVHDAAKMRRLARAYVAKYGEGWRLPGLDGVLTYEVTPSNAFGFGPQGRSHRFAERRGRDVHDETRWRFTTRDGRRPR